jgi:translation initiation factor 1
MRRMKKRGAPKPEPPSPFPSPFAGLAERLGMKPEPAPPEERRLEAPARAVVRIERAGRGGRTVTVVERLALPPDALARFSQELRRELSCGGGLEGDAVVLQGDQRERVAALLARRGVTRVTVAK